MPKLLLSYLSFARQDSIVCVQEGFLDRLSTTNDSMVSQKHDFIEGSKIANNEILFRRVYQDSLILMVTNLSNNCSLLTQRKQSAFQTRDLKGIYKKKI